MNWNFIFSAWYSLLYIKLKGWVNHCSPTSIILWITIIIHSILLFFFFTFSFFFIFFHSRCIVFFFPTVLFFSFIFFLKIIFVNCTFLILSWLKDSLCNVFPLKYYGLLQCFSTWFFYFSKLYLSILFF